MVARRLVSAFGPFMKLNIGGGGIIATPGDKKRTRRKGGERGREGDGKRKLLRMVEKEHREGGQWGVGLRNENTDDSSVYLHMRGNSVLKLLPNPQLQTGKKSAKNILVVIMKVCLPSDPTCCGIRHPRAAMAPFSPFQH